MKQCWVIGYRKDYMVWYLSGPIFKVRGMVERVITHTGDSKGVSADFLQGEKGDYQPIFLPSLGASVPSPQQSLHQSHLPGLTAGQLRKFKGKYL